MSERAWLDQLATSLAERRGEEPSKLTNEKIGALLDVARDVAHGTERKNAPLATFLLGVHVGRKPGDGALDEAAAIARDLLPEEE